MRLRRGSQNPRGATIYPLSLDLLSWEHVLQRAQNSGASPGPVTQQLWHGLDSGSGTTCLRGDVSARARGHVGTYLRGDVHARGHFLVGTDVPGHLSARPGVSERKRRAQSWGNRALSVGPGVAAAMTPAPCGSELCLSTAAEGGRGARSGALGPWSCVSPLRPWRGRRARVPRAQRLGAWSESAVRLVSELPVSSFQRQRARACVCSAKVGPCAHTSVPPCACGRARPRPLAVSVGARAQRERTAIYSISRRAGGSSYRLGVRSMWSECSRVQLGEGEPGLGDLMPWAEAPLPPYPPGTWRKRPKFRCSCISRIRVIFFSGICCG